MIEIQALSKSYGSTTAVADLTFTVQPGTVTGFLGPNGAGKSTTMRMILGLDEPTSGTVLVNGRPPRSHAAPLREVGAMLDPRAVLPSRSARSHLLALAATSGIRRSRVEEVIDAVGLPAVAGRAAGKFSLGMAQRLGIAAALLGDPATVVLDEPVNGLDVEGIRWIRALLHDLAAAGKTVFVSSHLMSEIAQTATRLVVIGRGKLIADTTVADFIASAAPSAVRVLSSDQGALAALLLRSPGVAVTPADGGALLVTGLPAGRVGQAAATAGIAVYQLATEQASLEDAFIDLTSDAVEYRAALGITNPAMARLPGPREPGAIAPSSHRAPASGPASLAGNFPAWSRCAPRPGHGHWWRAGEAWARSGWSFVRLAGDTGR
jgi:ABC-2 type transport system ATP-binding protein